MSIEALPLSLCPDCLRKLADGDESADVVNLPLGGALGRRGAHIVCAYCKHSKAGAHALVAPGRRLEWTIKSPISSLEFAQLCRSLPGMYAAVIAAYLDANGETQPAEVH
jgi:hypothetical protein